MMEHCQNCGAEITGPGMTGMEVTIRQQGSGVLMIPALFWCSKKECIAHGLEEEKSFLDLLHKGNVSIEEILHEDE